MLVAFASFVLHGSAMARVTPMHSASDAVVPQHDHGASAAHSHEAADHNHDATPDAPDHHGANGACCGSFCSVAIAPLARGNVMSRVGTTEALPSFQADGHGIPDESPTKPPRTPDIA